MWLLLVTAVKTLTTWLWVMIPFMLVQLLAGLGVGYLTMQGLDSLVPDLQTALMGYLGDLPNDVLAVLNLAGLTDAINMIISAYAAFITIKAVNGTLTKVRMKQSVFTA